MILTLMCREKKDNFDIAYGDILLFNPRVEVLIPTPSAFILNDAQNVNMNVVSQESKIIEGQSPFNITVGRLDANLNLNLPSDVYHYKSQTWFAITAFDQTR